MANVDPKGDHYPHPQRFHVVVHPPFDMGQVLRRVLSTVGDAPRTFVRGSQSTRSGSRPLVNIRFRKIR